MTGKIKSIPSKNGQQANYAFVKNTADGVEYFLHVSDLQNTWDELKVTIATKKEALIEFEPNVGLKGPRATMAVITNL